MQTARDDTSAFPQSIFIHALYMLFLITHPFDQLAYALASCTPHAFTLVLLEFIVASAFFMQTTIFNKCTYEPACQ